MVDQPRASICGLIIFCAIYAMLAAEARAQYGAYLSGAGAINRSMAGASTAAPLSAAGAMYWNPATLTGLPRSELEASAELLAPYTRLASSVPANSLLPGVPPIDLAGESSTDRGSFPLPTMALAYNPECSSWSFGLAAFPVAGFGVDYPGSTTNPVLMAPPPAGIGFGPIASEYWVMQIVPAAAYRLSDRLSVAAGPTIDMATLRLDPAVFAAPDDANGDGFASYPNGSHTQTTWGGGFVVGAYYTADPWAFGASVRSPQWFETFQFNSANELGQPRDLRIDVDLPLIVSLGTAYHWGRWLLALDVRYLDHGNADGFGDQGFNPDGSIRGLGWESSYAVSIGTQYRLNDCATARLAYGWHENPVPDSQSSFNVASPTVVEHTIGAGLSLNVTPDFMLSLAYLHCFENSIEGPLVTPFGAVPGTSVRNTTAGDAIVVGATVAFGGCRRCRCCPSNCCQPASAGDYLNAPAAE